MNQLDVKINGRLNDNENGHYTTQHNTNIFSLSFDNNTLVMIELEGLVLVCNGYTEKSSKFSHFKLLNQRVF